MEDKSYTCKVCAEVKAAAAFSAATRSFYTCRSCAAKRQRDLRRTDPAVRLAGRLRAREKRAGLPMKLSVAEIRNLLATENQDYVLEDLVTLVRAKHDAPLSPANAVLRRLAVLVDCGGSTAPHDATSAWCTARAAHERNGG